MSSESIEILHTLMTNQFFIFAMAIVFFFLAITLGGPSKSEAVLVEFWI